MVKQFQKKSDETGCGIQGIKKYDLDGKGINLIIINHVNYFSENYNQDYRKLY